MGWVLVWWFFCLVGVFLLKCSSLELRWYIVQKASNILTNWLLSSINWKYNPRTLQTHPHGVLSFEGSVVHFHSSQAKPGLLCYLSVSSPPLTLGLRLLQSAKRFNSKLSIPSCPSTTTKNEPQTQTNPPDSYWLPAYPCCTSTNTSARAWWGANRTATVVLKCKLDGVPVTVPETNAF